VCGLVEGGLGGLRLFEKVNRVVVVWICEVREGLSVSV
jgi:hypothetical protein